MEDSFYYFLVIFLINTLLTYILLITFIKIGRQVIVSKRFSVRLLKCKDNELTSLIRTTFGHNDQLIVVKSSSVLAFTMGYIKPTIVLSTGLIQLLEKDELRAVIEHETFHKNNCDPLKVFLLEIIAQSLWFIPLTHWCQQNYSIISEILADEYAVRKMGSEMELSTALIKLIKYHVSLKTTPSLVHFSGGSINFRLQQLVEPKEAIPIKLTTKTIFISVHVLLFFIGMVLLTTA
ncbi:M56 family metallopeptidase [Robertmurraya beringensis]|uniref:M56 family metallopeptidase n=1 Tax=Robertmurraya beringensis TaxID=641660 RepID=A0ABV6KXZ5_9BACI